MIPFNDLRSIYLRQKAEFDAAIQEVLTSGQLIGGPVVEGFEEEFARAVDARHAVGVANGTDAIALALRVHGIGPGDRIVVPGVSAYPTTTAVFQLSATPIFVDVLESDGTLDPAKLGRALESHDIKAVVVVHLYGNVGDMPAISALCRDRRVILVEDCAQAHLAELDGRKAGTWGDAAAWSFYPTKNLGAFGDGGAVTVSDSELAIRLKSFRNYGQRSRYEHVDSGVNSRLDPVQAAVMRVRLPLLGSDWERRRAIAARYDAALGAGAVAGVKPMQPRSGSIPSRHLYPVLLDDRGKRQEFQRHMFGHGVETLVHYPIPMSEQPATRRNPFIEMPLEVTRSLCGRVLSLPMHPLLDDGTIDRIISAIRQWDGRRGGAGYLTES